MSKKRENKMRKKGEKMIIEMDSVLSFRVMVMWLIVVVAIFFLLLVRGCQNYDIKITQQFINGNFTRTLLPGMQTTTWVK